MNAQDAQSTLRDILKGPTAQVFAVSRETRENAAGIVEYFDFYSFRVEPDGLVPIRLTGLIARALDWRYDDRREAIVTVGVGLNRAVECLEKLQWTLWPETRHKNTMRIATL